MVINPTNFDMSQIVNSGQCFRLQKKAETKENAVFSVVSGDNYTEITQTKDGFEFTATDEQFNSYWRHYFDLDTDYSLYEKPINDLGNPYISSAYQYGKGIRILNQDPFETLISFIISQRNNIPRIAKTIAQMSFKYGKKLIDPQTGVEYHTFPSASSILTNQEKLRLDGSLGYRWSYVVGAAKAVESLGIDYFTDLHTAYSRAISLHGVGPKVASCYTLFGLHDLSSFPIDKWMGLIIDERFNGSISLKGCSDIAGLLQQYMFYYERGLRGKLTDL